MIDPGAVVQIWDVKADRVGWVLSPPTDAHLSVEALQRCVGFARRWGFGSVEVLHIERVNDAQILSACARCKTVVAAWGDASLPVGRERTVSSLLRESHPNVLCLGRIRDQPRPPTAVPYTVAPEVF